MKLILGSFHFISISLSWIWQAFGAEFERPLLVRAHRVAPSAAFLGLLGAAKGGAVQRSAGGARGDLLRGPAGVGPERLKGHAAAAAPIALLALQSALAQRLQLPSSQAANPKPNGLTSGPRPGALGLLRMPFLGPGRAEMI